MKLNNETVLATVVLKRSEFDELIDIIGGDSIIDWQFINETDMKLYLNKSLRDYPCLPDKYDVKEGDEE